MARRSPKHAAPHGKGAPPDQRTPSAGRTLLRAGLVLTAAGVALGAGGAASASAAAPLPVGDVDALAAGQALTDSVGYATGPATDLRLNPLAKTGADPLDNAVGTQIADFKPVSTAAVTHPLSDGDSLGDLPVVGQVTGLITHH
ncbi:hypothetical protein ACWCP6_04870 [Streptomyces sp. NPDC002004]